MKRKTGGLLDEASRRLVVEAVQPGSGTHLEMVFTDACRLRVASGVSEPDLRALLTAAEPDEDVRFELVFDRGKPPF